MKPKRRPFKNTGGGDSLEWYQENFVEHCENCKSQLTVHSFRRGSPKYHKAIYVHCEKKNCRNQMVVICFYQ